MWVLGVHDGFDAGAALIKDGEIIAAINEERLNRCKPYKETFRRVLTQRVAVRAAFPERSIRAVLDLGGVGLADLDAVAILHGTPIDLLKRSFVEMPAKDWRRFVKVAPLLLHDLPARMLSKYFVRSQTLARLRAMGAGSRIEAVDHHLAHAASAFRTSPWESALVIAADMEGELVSTSVWLGTCDGLRRLNCTFFRFGSVGLFYGSVTAACSFAMHEDEWKLMGLAAYGHGNGLDAKLEPALRWNPSDGLPVSDIAHPRFKRQLRRLMANGTRPEDLAAAAQRRVEAVMARTVGYWVERAGVSQVALAGGVAHNVLMNKRIRALDCVSGLHVFPHPGDGGLAVGGALEVSARLRRARGEAAVTRALRHVYLGPSYSDEAIRAACEQKRLPARLSDDVWRETARLLACGKVVGWFQGRMEYGPRALGNRSILVHPGDRKFRDVVNQAVKFRERWRPFAVSVLEEHKHRYLADACTAPFMVLGFDVLPETAREIEATVHVDGTTRPQTVSAETNPTFHRLIRCFHEETGIPAVLNTSFNRAGEPIVCTPSDAIDCFLGSGMDYLVMGNLIASK